MTDQQDTLGDALDPAFERLLEYLKTDRSFDFTGYKRASLMRRVRHQMRAVGISSFDDYYDHLQVHPDEFTALFNTILINVTSFFRDGTPGSTSPRTPCRDCSPARATGPSASGARDAPPARRPTAWRWCWSRHSGRASSGSG